MPARGEAGDVSDEGIEGGCGEQADSGNGAQASDGRQLGGERAELDLDVFDASRKGGDFLAEGSEAWPECVFRTILIADSGRR